MEKHKVVHWVNFWKSKPMTQERIENSPHAFWLLTCGYDTYQRSSNHARLDTPWNAFTADGSELVNTIWQDRIVTVIDPESGQARRFVRLGMVSPKWKGVAKNHGRAASENIRSAVAKQAPVFGFEAAPKANQVDGARLIKHFFLDRVHRLKPWIGVTGDALKDRLQLAQAFHHQLGQAPESLLQDQGYMFELTDAGRVYPGVARTSFPSDATDNKDTSEATTEVTAPRPDDESPADADTYAVKALPILISHVLRQRDGVISPMTYQQLAERIGRRNRHGEPWARGMGFILGKVTQLIAEASEGWEDRPPYLSTVVVLKGNQNEGLPDDGVKVYWPDYEHLNDADRRAKVLQEYQRILQFGRRWLDILKSLGIPPLDADVSGSTTSSGGWGSGGESDAHKALKAFVAANAERFGADDSFMAIEEYALRSGDEIDVFFKSPEKWIGVEVKSRVSDGLLSDYQRGIYQAVKYSAVLRAQAVIDHPDAPPEVTVYLALEGALPQQFVAEANKLGVLLMENVSPGTDGGVSAA
jgi:hypothetical protein